MANNRIIKGLKLEDEIDVIYNRISTRMFLRDFLKFTEEHLNISNIPDSLSDLIQGTQQGEILRWNNTNGTWEVSDKIIVTDNGNIGIGGVLNPNYQVHVDNGDVYVRSGKMILSANTISAQAKLHIRGGVEEDPLRVDTDTSNNVFRIGSDDNVYVGSKDISIYGYTGQRIFFSAAQTISTESRELHIKGKSYLGYTGSIKVIGHRTINSSLMNFEDNELGDAIIHYEQGHRILGAERMRYDFITKEISHSTAGITVNDIVSGSLINAHSWKENLIGWWWNGSSAERKIITRQNIVNTDGSYYYGIGNDTNNLFKIYNDGRTSIGDNLTPLARLHIRSEVTEKPFRVDTDVTPYLINTLRRSTYDIVTIGGLSNWGLNHSFVIGGIGTVALYHSTNSQARIDFYKGGTREMYFGLSSLFNGIQSSRRFEFRNNSNINQFTIDMIGKVFVNGNSNTWGGSSINIEDHLDVAGNILTRREFLASNYTTIGDKGNSYSIKLQSAEFKVIGTTNTLVRNQFELQNRYDTTLGVDGAALYLSNVITHNTIPVSNIDLIKLTLDGDLELLQSGTNGKGIIMTDEALGTRHRITLINGVINVSKTL